MSLTTAEIVQVHNVLVKNQFPVKHIRLVGTTFSVLFSPKPIPFNTTNIVEFFRPLLKIKGLTNPDFVDILPVPIFFTLLSEYIPFYEETMTNLSELVYKFVETSESSNLWNVYKVNGAEFTLSLVDKQLNPFQYAWVVYNSHKDTKDKYELINTLFDAVKPWLNHELFVKMKEREDTARENWLFGDPAMDEKLQRRAETILKKKQESKQKKVNPEDLDIVEIEDKKNG